jgi:hypothetical protein
MGGAKIILGGICPPLHTITMSRNAQKAVGRDTIKIKYIGVGNWNQDKYIKWRDIGNGEDRNSYYDRVLKNYAKDDIQDLYVNLELFL